MGSLYEVHEDAGTIIDRAVLSLRDKEAMKFETDAGLSEATIRSIRRSFDDPGEIFIHGFLDGKRNRPVCFMLNSPYGGKVIVEMSDKASRAAGDPGNEY